MNHAHFAPTTTDGFRHNGLRAPLREWVPDADEEFCFGWDCAIHPERFTRGVQSRLCFHQRSKPTARPSPTVPRINGRATGIAIQASTTSPSETIAPALVPGMGMLPMAVIGRGLPRSILSNMDGTSAAGATSLDYAEPTSLEYADRDQSYREAGAGRA